jgi:hypothetical protein
LKLIDSKSRLYFRTVEDTNKMGSLIKTMWCITTTLTCQIMNGKYLTTNQFNSIVNAKSGYRSKSDFSIVKSNPSCFTSWIVILYQFSDFGECRLFELIDLCLH